MVVANAVAALSEIQELSGKPVLELTQATVAKLLRALNECTEWGQVGGSGGEGRAFVCCGGLHLSRRHLALALHAGFGWIPQL